MTDTPGKEWIERADKWVRKNAVPSTVSVKGLTTTAQILARELQSSFDQGDARGCERERKRTAKLVAAAERLLCSTPVVVAFGEKQLPECSCPACSLHGVLAEVSTPTPMTCWLHMMLEERLSYFPREKLNALGAEGWELVAVYYGAQCYRYFLKRPIDAGREGKAP